MHRLIWVVAGRTATVGFVMRRLNRLITIGSISELECCFFPVLPSSWLRWPDDQALVGTLSLLSMSPNWPNNICFSGWLRGFAFYLCQIYYTDFWAANINCWDTCCHSHGFSARLWGIKMLWLKLSFGRLEDVSIHLCSISVKLWSHISLFVHFLLVVDCLLILFRIAWWASAGKELTSWLSTCTV